MWFCALAGASCFQPASEVCSGGVICPSGFKCTADGKACRAQTNNCGNGTMQTGETCDDGNLTDCDGCSSDCHSMESCGNSVIDARCGETCDLGADIMACRGCAPDCKSQQTCGDGIVDSCKVEPLGRPVENHRLVPDKRMIAGMADDGRI